MLADWIERSKTEALTLGSGLLASDHELLKFAGCLALESIELMDVSRCDLQQSIEQLIECIGWTLDDDSHTAVVEVFDEAADWLVSCQIMYGVAHADALNASA